MNSCLEMNSGCDAFKQGTCTIDGSYLLHHILSIDQAECQVVIPFAITI